MSSTVFTVAPFVLISPRSVMGALKFSTRGMSRALMTNTRPAIT